MITHPVTTCCSCHSLTYHHCGFAIPLGCHPHTNLHLVSCRRSTAGPPLESAQTDTLHTQGSGQAALSTPHNQSCWVLLFRVCYGCGLRLCGGGQEGQNGTRELTAGLGSPALGGRPKYLLLHNCNRAVWLGLDVCGLDWRVERMSSSRPCMALNSFSVGVGFHLHMKMQWHLQSPLHSP